MKKFLFAVWEIAEVFFIALIAVAAIKYFLIQPFIVNGASMEPTFVDGDYLLVDEISYKFKEPDRGDVIVFKSPQDNSTYYIKRIIGLPEEKVEVDDEKIKIYNDQFPNGFNLEEPYLIDRFRNNWSGSVVFTLKNDQYFVLGDNRVNSLDSRYWGPLGKDAIVGSVKLRLWPVPEAKLFGATIYNY
ncbi:MAG: signal peptidase I [Candidatus Paceibacterota bacterium]|jgi:signal peptidase I